MPKFYKPGVQLAYMTTWSTTRFRAGQPVDGVERTLFTIPRGQTGQGFDRPASLVETNLKESGRIPGGLAVAVYGVVWDVIGTPADRENLLVHGALTWVFLNTHIDIAPMTLRWWTGGELPDDGRGGLNISSGYFEMKDPPLQIPSNATFGILARFSPDAAPIGHGGDAFLRVTLVCAYQTTVEVG